MNEEVDEKRRPFGVSLISIFNILVGLVMVVLFAIYYGTGYGLAYQGLAQQDIGTTLKEKPLLPLAVSFFVLIAGYSLHRGILAFITAYGLWKGHSWAWWFAVILQSVEILTSILAMPFAFARYLIASSLQQTIYMGSPSAIGSIIISVVILLYMFRPHVKEYFEVK